MKILTASALRCVECAHTVDIVPYLVAPTAGRDHCESGGKMSLFIEFFGEFYVVGVVVDRLAGILTIHSLEHSNGRVFEFLAGDKSVPA